MGDQSDAKARRARVARFALQIIAVPSDVLFCSFQTTVSFLPTRSVAQHPATSTRSFMIRLFIRIQRHFLLFYNYKLFLKISNSFNFPWIYEYK